MNPGAGPAQQIAAAAAAAAAPARPPEQPVAVVRKGREYMITGNQSVVRSGNEIQVKTERRELSLALSEMNKGSWVVFELPGFATAAAGAKQDSLDALRKASDTSYFKDKDSLWVKLFEIGRAHV